MTKEVTLSVPKSKKAPDAPRRFKSAYIFFSMQKHREIRSKLPNTATTTDVAKLVSKAWKSLSIDERSVWEEMSNIDKMRYEMEKSMYRGPWKVATKQKREENVKRDKSGKGGDMYPSASRADSGPVIPPAPKRPASAFLSYSNSRRAKVKDENPHLRRGEISKLLARMWAEAPEDVRKEYRDRELLFREEYKTKHKEWRRKADSIRSSWREKREMAALEAIEDQQRKELEALQQRIDMHSSGLHKPSGSYATASNPYDSKEAHENEQATTHPSPEIITTRGSQETSLTLGCDFDNDNDLKGQLRLTADTSPPSPSLSQILRPCFVVPQSLAHGLCSQLSRLNDTAVECEHLQRAGLPERSACEGHVSGSDHSQLSIFPMETPDLSYFNEDPSLLHPDVCCGYTGPAQSKRQVKEHPTIAAAFQLSKPGETGWLLDETGDNWNRSNNHHTPTTGAHQLVAAAIAAAEACED